MAESVVYRQHRKQRHIKIAAALSRQTPGACLDRRTALMLGVALTSWSIADSTSAAVICADEDTAEAGDECRRSLLAKDAGAKQDYQAAKSRQVSGSVAGGVPVSVIDDEYTRATVALSNKIEQYFTMDVYDRQRPPLIKSLKTDGLAWVSKYARGGSVRKQSARRFYVAVDAIVGHLASNGLAPFPTAKSKLVRSQLEEAKALLADSK
eukprot:jgi/Chrzof1/14970/Cz09g22190.t1_PSB27B[v5.2]